MSNRANSWFVYIIQYRLDRLYTGITTDVSRRFAEHSGGGYKAAKALRGKGPYELVYCEEASTRAEALSREAQIKKMTKAQKQKLLGNCVYDLSAFKHGVKEQEG